MSAFVAKKKKKKSNTTNFNSHLLKLALACVINSSCSNAIQKPTRDFKKYQCTNIFIDHIFVKINQYFSHNKDRSNTMAADRNEKCTTIKQQ